MLKKEFLKICSKKKQRFQSFRRVIISREHILRCYESINEEILWYTPISRFHLIGRADFLQANKEAYPRGAKHHVIAELDKPTKENIGYIQNYKKENPNFEIRFLYPSLSRHIHNLG